MRDVLVRGLYSFFPRLRAAPRPRPAQGPYRRHPASRRRLPLPAAEFGSRFRPGLSLLRRARRLRPLLAPRRPARREPAARAAVVPGSAVARRRGGRSVHAVPRLEHLSVGPCTS
ncbi:hypothetical protein STRAU_6492 [Streptomyces aurantiacus JA 4570]|uniref:Uncharacterized protein n=1 Tax=Streptomyces aurantiacus JA 4570 TaxID=1286094 RepID=S3ZQ20_9ACTN|nr:hypothetical protein STRAU_6492 [Streptomyces aurantiacus JA 4570]